MLRQFNHSFMRTSHGTHMIGLIQLDESVTSHIQMCYSLFGTRVVQNIAASTHGCRFIQMFNLTLSNVIYSTHLYAQNSSSIECCCLLLAFYLVFEWLEIPEHLHIVAPAHSSPTGTCVSSDIRSAAQQAVSSPHPLYMHAI